MNVDVAEKIRNAILKEEWKTADRLPAEPEHARQLGISRPALREAVSTLIGEGLVRILRGHGTQVLEWISHGSLDLIVPILRLRRGKPSAVRLLQQILWLRRALYQQAIPLLLSADLNEQKLRFEALELRIGGGAHWREVPVLLRSEERVLCMIMMQTRNLPLIMVTHAIRRMLESVLPESDGFDLDPTHKEFDALVEAVISKDAALISALLDERCRHREALYLGLVAPPVAADQPAACAPNVA